MRQGCQPGRQESSLKLVDHVMTTPCGKCKPLQSLQQRLTIITSLTPTLVTDGSLTIFSINTLSVKEDINCLDGSDLFRESERRPSSRSCAGSRIESKAPFRGLSIRWRMRSTSILRLSMNRLMLLQYLIQAHILLPANDHDSLLTQRHPSRHHK